MLLTTFAGRRRTMKQIYEQHNVGKPYIPSNYKDVLAKLEFEGKIQADPPAQNDLSGRAKSRLRIRSL